MKWIFLGIVFLFSMSACKNPEAIPKTVLPPPQMQAILIDVHLLEAGSQVSPNIIPFQEGYAAIFKKHKTSPTQYQKSMQFYQNHPKLLETVYQGVRDTFEKKIAQ